MLSVRLRPVVAACAVTVIASTATVLTPVGALADPHPSAPGLVSSDPANTTPDVLDGHVDSFAQVGDTMIVAGQFSKVEQGGVVYDRDNVFAFRISTGDLIAAFQPNVSGEVFDLQLTPGAHSVILAGAFSDVDGAADTAKVAEVAVTDGSVVAGFHSPKPNGLVRDIVAANGFYYIAGAFTKLHGQPRGYLAALEPDGSDSGTVHLDVSGVNTGGATNVRSMDVSPDGSKLVVAGNFAVIDGAPRGQLAVIDVTPSGSALDDWTTTRFAPQCGPMFDEYMRDVAFSPDGSYFVVAATGGPRGRPSTHLLCDSVTRWNLDATLPAQPAWVDYTGGDTTTAAVVDDDAVYVGGHQRWFNNSEGFNSAGPGAVAREGIAALDPLNGLPYSWNPGRRRGYGVYGFLLTSDGLWVGHDTKAFGGELRQRIAFCPRAGGEALPSYETTALPGRLAELRPRGAVNVRTFDGHNATPVSTLASTQSWKGLLGAFMVDDQLYAAWSDGTMTVQPFDGTTLGTRSQVNLRGAFPDLSSTGALFFDRTTHRLYYTLNGEHGLFYRYFQPESGVVGVQQFRAGSTGLPTSVVGNAFVVGSHLFVTNSATGDLVRLHWDAASGAASGRAVAILGPSIDGQSYRTGGLVAFD